MGVANKHDIRIPQLYSIPSSHTFDHNINSQLRSVCVTAWLNRNQSVVLLAHPAYTIAIVWTCAHFVWIFKYTIDYTIIHLVTT
jgi:predicted DNA-binding ribbon-helix-helix protein